MTTKLYNFVFCASALALSFSLPLQGQVQLEQVWETPADLKEPESVLYDEENQVLYVSNINDPSGGTDNNGSIGKISLDGELQEVEWVYGGMDAPKGLGLYRGLLYVADPEKVVVINTETGKIQHSIEIVGAGMLNDITISNQGEVFVTDSKNPRIYRIRNNQAEVWLEDERLKQPNGILSHQGKMYLVDMATGVFYEINNDTKALTTIAEGMKGGDGIAAYKNDFFISNWNGEIWHVTKDGSIHKILDTKQEKVNAADITYIPEHNLLLVPTFFANKVVAYRVK